jgi:hypothetical protein
VITEPGLHVARLVKPLLEQLLNALLCRGTPECGQESVPLRCDLSVGRQAVQVDQSFRLGDRLLVERRDPGGERIDERVELTIVQRSIDVAVPLG